MKQYLRFLSISTSLLLVLLGYSYAQSNQIVTNGNITTPVNFTGNGCVYNWINSNPSIGLPASGTGDIPSFIVTNNGNTPVTATIKATPSPTGFAYIANYGANTLTVINTATSTVAATITVGNGPLGVTVSPDGNLVYVSNANDNTVSVVNTANNQVIATIPVGKQPAEIGVSPNGSRVYVANFASNTVSIINAANNTLIGTIFLSDTPQGAIVSKDCSY